MTADPDNLRQLLAEWGTPTISAAGTNGSEPPPRTHAQPQPEASTESTPKSAAWVDAERSAGNLPIGHVVRWRTPRTTGVGQIARVNGDQVTVRTWLPARTKEITTTAERITLLPDLNELVQDAIVDAALLARTHR